MAVISPPFNNGIKYSAIVNLTSFGATDLVGHNAIKAIAGAAGTFTGVTMDGVTVTDYLALGQVMPIRYKRITVSGSITNFLLLA